MLAVSEALARNRILHGLPAHERNIVQQHLEVTQVHLGEILDRPGEAIRYLYFPVDAALSLMDIKDSSHTLDVALIGPEGCSGASVAQGSDASPCLNIVEIDGCTVRMPVSSLAEYLVKLPYVSAVLSRFNLLLLRQTVISVGCSQFHSADQRIARWLLAHSHRASLTVFPFTLDFLSAQVGIDAQQVRPIVEHMQQRGLITKRANSIAICDQQALLQQSCDCFQLVKDATDGYVEALTRLSRAYAH
jgi:CRP-like cAMP-binding protein